MEQKRSEISEAFKSVFYIGELTHVRLSRYIFKYELERYDVSMGNTYFFDKTSNAWEPVTRYKVPVESNCCKQQRNAYVQDKSHLKNHQAGARC